LEENWGISATVLHDCPAPHLRPIEQEERIQFLTRLSSSYPPLEKLISQDVEDVERVEGGLGVEGGRGVGLLVSATSWTPDEDFSILLSALCMYEQKVEEAGDLPHLVCVITGKGPQKEFYLKRISSLGLGYVSFVTPWLEIGDYPLMLASADLGVSLHTSSSGLDLPMKVVDMFGVGLPVAAKDFPALDELVKDQENGRIFSSPEELAEILGEWFKGFSVHPSPLHQPYRDRLNNYRAKGWRENWNSVAMPLFERSQSIDSVSVLRPFLFLLCGIFLSSFLLSLLPTVG